MFAKLASVLSSSLVGPSAGLLRRLGCAAALFALPFATGCSATGKWRNVGEPPIWNTEIPAPTGEEVERGSIAVVLHCPLMEDQEEFVGELRNAVVEQCRRAGMGEVKLWRDRSKRPQYEVIVYEAGEDGSFEFNSEAGVLGGVGAGIATGILTQDLGYAIGVTTLGGGLIGFLTSEKLENYAFAGVCRQRTDIKGIKVDDASRGLQSAQGGGLVDRETGAVQNASSERRMFEKAQWRYETSSYEFPFMFVIPVTGGSLSSKGARDEAARQTFLKRFPKFVTGGTAL